MLGMPRWLPWVLLVACGPRVVKAPPSKPDDPKLDVTAPWTDPEGFWIKGTMPPPRKLSDALVDEGAQPIVIRGATILTAAGQRFDSGTIILERGAITHVGADAPAPQGALVIDGKGKFVTPGIIDAHSHMGVYPAPSARAHGDGNEA